MIADRILQLLLHTTESKWPVSFLQSEDLCIDIITS